MLLYDWNKIFEISEGNTYVIFIIFRMLTCKLVPENKYDPIYEFSKKNFHEIEINMFERMKMKPPGFFSNEVLTSTNYIIKQKIKIGKMYYIDRDNFGIIVRVSKVAKS